MYAKSALESAQYRLQCKPLSVPDRSTSANAQSEQAMASSSSVDAPTVSSGSSDVPPLSKKAKLFSFMASSTRPSSQANLQLEQLTSADIKEQYTVFASDNDASGRGLHVFNEQRFSALRPLARKIFTAPASSAASERVFSKAGLIMRPTRARLSKSNLSKLVFLSCNELLE